VAGHVDVYQRTPPYVLPKADRPYREAEQNLYDRLPLVRKADRLRLFLYGELLTSGFVLSPKLLAEPMRQWRRQLDTQIADPGCAPSACPTTRWAASGWCSPPTGTRPWPGPTWS